MKLLVNFVFLFLSTLLEAKNLYYKPRQCLKSRKCSRELAAIVYKPETCALKYLDRISTTLKARSQILFTPQADSFIYSFENTYNVLLTLVDAMGNTMEYFPNQTKVPGTPVKYTDTAQSYLNFPGFVRQASNQKFYYTFSIFSEDGQYYDVTLSMPLAKDPIFC